MKIHSILLILAFASGCSILRQSPELQSAGLDFEVLAELIPALINSDELSVEERIELLERAKEGTTDARIHARIDREIARQLKKLEVPEPEPVLTPTPKPPAEREYCQLFNTYRNGFLYKPRSESNTNLVVLLPTNQRGLWESVTLVDANKQPLEVGRFDGDTHNGNRPHFRFNQTGAAYGDNLFIHQRNKDGTLIEYVIPRGCARVQ